MSSTTPQRKLILVDASREAPAQAASPARRVFDHWVFMFGKNPTRVGFGPQRRRQLEVWLTVYTEGTLCLAIDGAAADEWVAAHWAVGSAIDWILESEARIERFAEAGERVHCRLARAAQAPAEPVEAEVTAEQAAAHRQRVLAMALQMSGRA